MIPWLVYMFLDLAVQTAQALASCLWSCLSCYNLGGKKNMAPETLKGREDFVHCKTNEVKNLCIWRRFCFLSKPFTLFL